MDTLATTTQRVEILKFAYEFAIQKYSHDVMLYQSGLTHDAPAFPTRQEVMDLATEFLHFVWS